MNAGESQHDDLNRDSGEPSRELDELLRMAEWPEPTPEALGRLERRWARVSPAAHQRRKRWTMMIAAAAAVLVVACGLQVWRHRTAGEPAEMVDGQAAPDGLPDDRVIEQRDSVSVPDDVDSSEGGDAIEKPVPEKREKRRPRTQRQWMARAQELDRQLEDALERLAGQGAATAEVADALRDEQAFFVGRLRVLVASSEGQPQAVALDLLEDLSGDAANVSLMRLVQLPQCHAVVARRLAPRVDSATLQSWIGLERDADLQRELLTELVSRSDRQSLTLYLQLVVAKQTRKPALVVLHELEEPPSEQLLIYLASPHRELRLAAVLALAETTDPRVVDPLINMVTANYHRQEALMSLMRRQDARSMQFVHQVARHEAFAGAVLSARNRLRFLVN